VGGGKYDIEVTCYDRLLSECDARVKANEDSRIETGETQLSLQEFKSGSHR
jgi:hypothetical protein